MIKWQQKRCLLPEALNFRALDIKLADDFDGKEFVILFFFAFIYIAKWALAEKTLDLEPFWEDVLSVLVKLHFES